MAGLLQFLPFKRLLGWLLLALSSAIGCSGPPLVETEEGLRVADAMYTAVTSKKTELLDRCDQRLSDLKSEGKLSEHAFDGLAVISQKARSGQWQKAAEDLDWFIRRQPAIH